MIQTTPPTQTEFQARPTSNLSTLACYHMEPAFAHNLCRTCAERSFYVTNETGERIPAYTPTDHQAFFHSRTETNVLFWGGRGSGKSKALRWEAHARCLASPNFKAAILRRNYPELEQSHLVFIEQEMKMLGGYYHSTSHTAHYPNGSRLRFAHCAAEKDVLVLLGSEYYWLGFDELSTFSWDMYTMLSASVRVPKNYPAKALIRSATNPLGESTEDVMHYFVWKDAESQGYDPASWFSIKANLEHNPYLPEEYSKQFVGLPDHVRKAWESGDYALENALFKFKPTIKAMIEGQERTIPYHVIHDIDLAKVLPAAQIYRAYDHGWFPDPAVCLWIAHLGNRYIVFHEQQWWETVVSDIAKDIKQTEEMFTNMVYGPRSGQKLRVLTTFCDPVIDINTGADLRTIKDIFESNGVAMDCSINSREQFASSIHTMLTEEAMPNVPRLQIYGPSCPWLVRTLPQMRYDPKHSLRMADHKHDHWTIALAYFGISSATWSRPDPAETKRFRPFLLREKKPKRNPYYSPY